MKGFIGAAALLALLHGTSSAIMTSALYLTTFHEVGSIEPHEVHVLQHADGFLGQDGWERPAHAYAPAVSGCTVRIAPGFDGVNGVGVDGVEYATDGSATGTTYGYDSAYPEDLDLTAILDATTDGTYNYGFGRGVNSQGKVYRWNADWSAPDLLCDLTSTGLLNPTAITYDRNGNLWVSGMQDDGSIGEEIKYWVHNVSLGGSILRSFEIGHDSNFLAMDYADGTLWTQDIYTKTLYQYDTDGVVLSMVTSVDLPTLRLYAGAEFEYGVVPEPGTLLLVGSVLVGCGLLGWRRRWGAGR